MVFALEELDWQVAEGVVALGVIHPHERGDLWKLVC